MHCPSLVIHFLHIESPSSTYKGLILHISSPSVDFRGSHNCQKDPTPPPETQATSSMISIHRVSSFLVHQLSAEVCGYRPAPLCPPVSENSLSESMPLRDAVQSAMHDVSNVLLNIIWLTTAPSCGSRWRKVHYLGPHTQVQLNSVTIRQPDINVTEETHQYPLAPAWESFPTLQVDKDSRCQVKGAFRSHRSTLSGSIQIHPLQLDLPFQHQYQGFCFRVRGWAGGHFSVEPVVFSTSGSQSSKHIKHTTHHLWDGEAALGSHSHHMWVQLL